MRVRDSVCSYTLVLSALVAGGCDRDAVPTLGQGLGIDVVAAGLVTPWSLALATDGRLFVAERPGRIRIVVNDSLVRAPWATIPAFDGAEQGWETGLMGLALHPDFPANPQVYICYSERTDAGRIVNRVAQLSEVDGRGQQLTVLLDNIPAGNFHNGCRVKTGPDRKLYVTTGDAYLEASAQDAASLAGKVLRLNLDGSIPDDNPIPGSLVW